MPRVDAWPHGLLIALPLAGSWAVLRHERALVSLNDAQTLDLVFGVLMLAVGVHARNYPFQHATSVLQSAALPLPRALLWRRAVRHQRRVLSVHYALGLLVVGTWGAAIAGMAVGAQWRNAYLIGIIPALLVLWVRAKVKEPEGWKKAKGDTQKRAGSYLDLFGDPRWRKHALLGMALAAVGLASFWAVGVATQGLAKDIYNGQLTPKYFESQLASNPSAEVLTS